MKDSGSNFPQSAADPVPLEGTYGNDLWTAPEQVGPRPSLEYCEDLYTTPETDLQQGATFARPTNANIDLNTMAPLVQQVRFLLFLVVLRSINQDM